MMTIEKAYEKFYKLLEQIHNSKFHQVSSMNCIKIWNLKLDRKNNKRMQICMKIDKGEYLI